MLQVTVNLVNFYITFRNKEHVFLQLCVVAAAFFTISVFGVSFSTVALYQAHARLIYCSKFTVLLSPHFCSEKAEKGKFDVSFWV